MKKIYNDSCWYESNYNSLGYGWLLRSLNKLDLKQNYVFASLSANAAFYERDVYLSHRKEFNPIYYVGDIQASNLKNNHISSFDNFIYIDGNNDAASVDDTLIPVQVDVILDCKGALWYCLNGKNKNKIKELVKKYISLLAEDGKLLIDQYDFSKFQYFFNNFKFKFVDKANKICRSDLDYFAERSTYGILCGRIGENKISSIAEKLDVNMKDYGKPLSDQMNVACITKEKLILLLEEI